MTQSPADGSPRRATLETLARATRAGRVDRREFLALASVLGAGAAAAYGALGLAVPGVARAAGPRRGGVLRIGQPVLEITDPRTFDWPEKSNVARQFCEPLVRWEADGRFSPSLLAAWQVSKDAMTYTLHVRPGVTWTNGDTFTADDVIHNIRRFADRRIEGNSMAARMIALRDDGADTLAEDAVERVDDLTLRLNLRSPDISLIPSFGDYPALCVHPSFGDAGIVIKRTILPGATFWNDWTKYPFSTTSWGARPLGVQVYALAYRSGEA